MKKIFLLISLLLVLFSITSCNNNEDKMRLRIIASSNQEEDLKDKTLIKNTIKELFEEGIISYESLNVDNLKYHLSKKLDWNLYKKLKIEKCKSYYPAKAYKNEIIPAGDFETLLITIDKGEGHNFWTLLYPEYFGYEFEENNEIEYRSYFYDLFN